MWYHLPIQQYGRRMIGFLHSAQTFICSPWPEPGGDDFWQQAGQQRMLAQIGVVAVLRRVAERHAAKASM
jgi:hypothetical protein